MLLSTTIEHISRQCYHSESRQKLRNYKARSSYTQFMILFLL
uniref:Uncharacterized protein n=1 Tax=Arundo donax TaxID=35708 RepID=A0A0A9AI41_ARUDO